MNKYYISLCRGLAGYYVCVEATSEDIVRQHASKYYGRLWCSVYKEPYRRPGVKCIVINEDDPVLLNDCPDYE